MKVVICGAEIAGLVLAKRISTLRAEEMLLGGACCLGRSERVRA
jgi:hypothetical protein